MSRKKSKKQQQYKLNGPLGIADLVDPVVPKKEGYEQISTPPTAAEYGWPVTCTSKDKVETASMMLPLSLPEHAETPL